MGEAVGAHRRITAAQRPNSKSREPAHRMTHETASPRARKPSRNLILTQPVFDRLPPPHDRRPSTPDRPISPPISPVSTGPAARTARPPLAPRLTCVSFEQHLSEPHGRGPCPTARSSAAPAGMCAATSCGSRSGPPPAAWRDLLRRRGLRRDARGRQRLRRCLPRTRRCSRRRGSARERSRPSSAASRPGKRHAADLAADALHRALSKAWAREDVPRRSARRTACWSG